VDRWDLAKTESADEVYARITLGDDVQKALLDLPIEFREAIILCDVVGLSYDEIAQAASVPIGTVRSRIHRGRKLMRESLT
ncbi:MAG: sigma factor-like helix-turn-helix DNA-binding protein, partial [Actinomycetota bacterium]|nr:sigma factor-like helix-turn-helix DNA-binding protein [Actinomycetota bacterium]